MEPLASQFRSAYYSYFFPSSTLSFDEIMVRFYGRSLDTYKMPNKLIKQGYKIYALADAGYI